MGVLKKLSAFMNQETAAENGSQYFVVVQRWQFVLMIIYYLLFMGICAVCGYYENVLLIPIWIAVMVIGLYLSFRYSEKVMLALYMLMMVGWVFVAARYYGWNSGGQHFLLPMLVMFFFCVHFNNLEKISGMLLILLLRIGLFISCQYHDPLYTMSSAPLIAIQVLNSLTLFASMTLICVNFSSNIQASEKKLMNANNKLRMLANTDQLTQLPNRRYMIEVIEEWVQNHPRSYYSVAMADIDFFKRVNDTWGHECGDATLKALSDLFKRHMEQQGEVCRWGGEEFFFFFPDMNLDQALEACQKMALEIRQMKISYEEILVQVTITIGLEEGDYNTFDFNELVKKADEKLYMGKQMGRDRVVA